MNTLNSLTLDAFLYKLADRREKTAVLTAAADSVLESMHPHQQEFILDKARYKCALVGRRGGKTVSCLGLILNTMLRRPNAKVLYLCLTRGQAEKNLWAPLRQFDHDHRIQGRFTGGGSMEYKYEAPNGSTLWLRGGDTRSELEKNRGQFFDLIVIDEGKSFSVSVLTEGINEVLRPTLSDRQGTLAMIGTPGNILAGPFYAATTGAPGWSRHTWSIRDNVALPHLWKEALETKRMNGWTDESPAWRREYLGEWCPSSDVMVFHGFEESRNTYKGDLPDGHNWYYIIGLYLGFEDDWAVSVSAYSDTHPTMYQLYEHTEERTDMDAVATCLSRLLARYEPEVLVVNQNKFKDAVLDAFAHNYGIHLEPADTKQRLDNIELLNTDLSNGRIKLHALSKLIPEWQHLQWEADKVGREFGEGLPYQLSEAFLYTWNYAFHHQYRTVDEGPAKGTNEYYEMLEQRAFDAEVERRTGGDRTNIGRMKTTLGK